MRSTQYRTLLSLKLGCISVKTNSDAQKTLRSSMEHLQKELFAKDQPTLFEDLDFEIPKSKYSRILLKLSGEALMGKEGSGLDDIVAKRFANDIVKARLDHDVEIAIVVGGGNFWRGAKHSEMDRSAADFCGMLATVINAIALKDRLEKLGQPTRVMTAIHMNQVAEPYIRGKAMRHLEKGRVVIFAGGTGNPFFTTDTAAALRAAEISADALLMAKNGVDGVYDSDPNLNSDAIKYDELDYLDIINNDLGVMDSTAATHAMGNDLPIVVFDGLKEGGLQEAIVNPRAGTLIN